MLIGYARVSSDRQDTALQLEALKAAGCERIFQDHASGVTGRQRPQWDALLDQLRPDDVVLVWKLDRLVRSIQDFAAILAGLDSRECGLRSLTQNIDSSGPAGRMVTTIIVAVAEYELSLIRDRTRAGRQAAEKKGVRFGPPVKMTEQRIALCRKLRSEGHSVRDTAKAIGVSKTTISRYCKGGKMTQSFSI